MFVGIVLLLLLGILLLLLGFLLLFFDLLLLLLLNPLIVFLLGGLQLPGGCGFSQFCLCRGRSGAIYDCWLWELTAEVIIT